MSVPESCILRFLSAEEKETVFFLHNVEINLIVVLGKELHRVWTWISG